MIIVIITVASRIFFRYRCKDVAEDDRSSSIESHVRSQAVTSLGRARTGDDIYSDNPLRRSKTILMGDWRDVRERTGTRRPTARRRRPRTRMNRVRASCGRDCGRGISVAPSVSPFGQRERAEVDVESRGNREIIGTGVVSPPTSTIVH